jgi:hypothetical protein
MIVYRYEQSSIMRFCSHVHFEAGRRGVGAGGLLCRAAFRSSAFFSRTFDSRSRLSLSSFFSVSRRSFSLCASRASLLLALLLWEELGLVPELAVTVDPRLP